MEGTKKQIESYGIWGGAATVVTGIGVLLGVGIDAIQLADSLAVIAVAVANIVTGALAWWGRLRATKKIA